MKLLASLVPARHLVDDAGPCRLAIRPSRNQVGVNDDGHGRLPATLRGRFLIGLVTYLRISDTASRIGMSRRSSRRRSTASSPRRRRSSTVSVFRVSNGAILGHRRRPPARVIPPLSPDAHRSERDTPLPARRPGGRPGHLGAYLPERAHGLSPLATTHAHAVVHAGLPRGASSPPHAGTRQLSQRTHAIAGAFEKSRVATGARPTATAT